MRRESDNELILPSIIQFHFPARWKYDVLRALYYFALVKAPYDPRMEEALALLKEKFQKGYLGKGPTYTGLLHFVMEKSKIGRMNSFRGLFVLKHYDRECYDKLINQEL